MCRLDENTARQQSSSSARLTLSGSADLFDRTGNILPADAAASRLAAIKDKLDDTHFVWYGPTTNGSAVYYRIQGPALLIEYAPQGGTNHIHTIIRDPSNDYGKELTKK
jgi:hypothetical protein